MGRWGDDVRGRLHRPRLPLPRGVSINAPQGGQQQSLCCVCVGAPARACLQLGLQPALQQRDISGVPGESHGSSAAPREWWAMTGVGPLINYLQLRPRGFGRPSPGWEAFQCNRVRPQAEMGHLQGRPEAT